MNHYSRLIQACAVLAFWLGVDSSRMQADPLRTQTVTLNQGWNAVFLEVHPSESDPANLFAGTPIDVAAVFTPKSSVQFMSDPGVNLFQQAGWGVWYEESRPDSFLKTLSIIEGQQAYLIHAQNDYTWNVNGLVVVPDITWHADAFNFVGFSVHPQAAPTFEQFFAGSKALRDNPIYRLTDGSWRRITNPDQDVMKSGEAFWIYCEGASKYTGPLQVETPTRHGLFLIDQTSDLILRNQTDHPVTPTLEHYPSDSSAVPISLLIQVVGDEAQPVRFVSQSKPISFWTQSLPSLDGGGALKVPFEGRLEDMDNALQYSIIKIITDLGTETWIPVVGVRGDLDEN